MKNYGDRGGCYRPRRITHSEISIIFHLLLDIYYRNITSTVVWHAVSKKTLVEACQINSTTNQILYYNK